MGNYCIAITGKKQNHLENNQIILTLNTIVNGGLCEEIELDCIFKFYNWSLRTGITTVLLNGYLETAVKSKLDYYYFFKKITISC